MANNPLFPWSSTLATQAQDDSRGYEKFIVSRLIDNMDNKPMEKETEVTALLPPALSPEFAQLLKMEASN